MSAAVQGDPTFRTPSQIRSDVVARRFTIGLVAVAVAVALLTSYIVLFPTSRLIVGFVVILLMMALMLFKIPIGIAMSAPAILGLYLLRGVDAVSGTLKEIVFGTFASWSLSVIPMFILMGIALGNSGLMSASFDTARKWLGRLPGGLAISTIFAGAGLATTSGSTIGITYAIGPTTVPEMIKSGYRPGLAMASTGMAGTLGIVIPPSILLVIYAGVAETPVGLQLLAGVVPGFLMAALYVLVIILWATLRPASAPRATSRYTWVERLASLVNLVPILLIVIVVIGGIFSGVFTATEAGAFGALIAVVVGLVVVIFRSKKNVASQPEAARTRPAVGQYVSSTLMETVSAVAGIFLLLLGVSLLTRVMALSGLAPSVADWVIGLGLNQLGFLLMLIPIYLVLGFFLDTLSMMLLTIPIFIAPLTALDVNLLWFGVFLIVLAEIDMIAPPFGVLNFVLLAISQSSTKGLGIKIGLTDVYKGVMPFMVACVVFLVILIAWPDLALWLPDISLSK